MHRCIWMAFVLVHSFSALPSELSIAKSSFALSLVPDLCCVLKLHPYFLPSTFSIPQMFVLVTCSSQNLEGQSSVEQVTVTLYTQGSIKWNCLSEEEPAMPYWKRMNSRRHDLNCLGDLFTCCPFISTPVRSTVICLSSGVSTSDFIFGFSFGNLSF